MGIENRSKFKYLNFNVLNPTYTHTQQFITICVYVITSLQYFK